MPQSICNVMRAVKSAALSALITLQIDYGNDKGGRKKSVIFSISMMDEIFSKAKKNRGKQQRQL
jgi:hypothetical protein